MNSGTIIYMRTVPGNPKVHALTQSLSCKMWDGTVHQIPQGFIWNGSSSGIFAPIFPRWNHPIASCRHDYRCSKARNAKERAWSDAEFRDDVGTTSWWITKQVGYIGVRLGALMGVGSNF